MARRARRARIVRVRRSERNNLYAAAVSNFSEFDVHQIAYFLAISVRMNNVIFLQLILSLKAEGEKAREEGGRRKDSW